MCAQWNNQGVVWHLFTCSIFITSDLPSPLVITTDEIMSTMVWTLPAWGKSHPILSLCGERHEECQLQGSLWGLCYGCAEVYQVLPCRGITTSPHGWVRTKQNFRGSPRGHEGWEWPGRVRHMSLGLWLDTQNWKAAFTWAVIEIVTTPLHDFINSYNYIETSTFSHTLTSNNSCYKQEFFFKCQVSAPEGALKGDTEIIGSKTIPWNLCEIKEVKKEQGRKYATLGARYIHLLSPSNNSLL